MRRLISLYTLVLFSPHICQAQISCVSAFIHNASGFEFAVVTKNNQNSSLDLALDPDNFTPVDCLSNQTLLVGMRLLAYQENFEKPRSFVLDFERKYAGRYLVYRPQKEINLSSALSEDISNLFYNASNDTNLAPRVIADRSGNLFLYGIGCLISSFLLHQFYPGIPFRPLSGPDFISVPLETDLDLDEIIYQSIPVSVLPRELVDLAFRYLSEVPSKIRVSSHNINVLEATRIDILNSRPVLQKQVLFGIASATAMSLGTWVAQYFDTNVSWGLHFVMAIACLWPAITLPWQMVKLYRAYQPMWIKNPFHWPYFFSSEGAAALCENPISSQPF